MGKLRVSGILMALILGVAVVFVLGVNSFASPPKGASSCLQGSGW